LIINDPVYGDTKIESPVIEELINTQVFQRLKDITQSGMPNGLNKFPSFTRFEHSLGVYLILRKFGASELEQVAGLVHDIAHRAFSHIYEWILDERQSGIEGVSESDTEKFIKDKEFIKVLKKYSISYIDLLDYSKFKILENSIPDLCADRLDYSFREYLMYKNSNYLYEQLGNKIDFSSIINSFYFNDIDSAELYGYEFLELQEEVWGGWDSVFRYQAIREIAIELINTGKISLHDFDNSEMIILQEIFSSQNPKVQNLVKLLKDNQLDTIPYFEKKVVKKFRYVDPFGIYDGDLVRLSSVSEKFKDRLKEAQEKNLLGHLI
jgi:uncharacterized protein